MKSRKEEIDKQRILACQWSKKYFLCEDCKDRFLCHTIKSRRFIISTVDYHWIDYEVFAENEQIARQLYSQYPDDRRIIHEIDHSSDAELQIEEDV